MSLYNSHLLICEVPHKNGTTVTSVCNVSVDRAQAIGLLEGELITSFPPQVCKKCVEGLKGEDLHLLYEITSWEKWHEAVSRGAVREQ